MSHQTTWPALEDAGLEDWCEGWSSVHCPVRWERPLSWIVPHDRFCFSGRDSSLQNKVQDAISIKSKWIIKGVDLKVYFRWHYLTEGIHPPVFSKEEWKQTNTSLRGWGKPIGHIALAGVIHILLCASWNYQNKNWSVRLISDLSKKTQTDKHRTLNW